MTDRIPAVGSVDPVDRREGERRERERRAAEKAAARSLVPLASDDAGFKPDSGPARPAVHVTAESGAAAFVAQQMGQRGQKRGLKGGPPVLDAARTAYLGTEYSGQAERRPVIGTARKTEV
jgi:hypothetical protein